MISAGMMHLIRGLVGSQRNAAALGVVSAVNDAGVAQTVNVSTGSGVNRAEVEVHQPWGFSSVPPPDGAISVVMKLGDDPGNMMALPLANPTARFVGLLEGEAVMYGGDGTRVRIRQGAILELWGGAIKLYANGTTVTGDTEVVGDLTATGQVADFAGTLDALRRAYDAHTHPGGGTTSNPVSE